MATSERSSVAPSPGLARPLALMVAAGLLAAVVAAALTGATTPLDLADAGPLVRWGVPLVSAVSTIAASATVGLLGLAAFLAPERTSTTAGGRRPCGSPPSRPPSGPSPPSSRWC